MDRYDEAMPFEEDDDWERFLSVVAAFKQYRTYSLQRINRRSHYILTLPADHQRRLTRYAGYLAKFRACVEVNEAFLDLLVKDSGNVFRDQQQAPRSTYCNGHAHQETQPRLEVEKVQITLRQFVRDWSAEGAAEREQCYTPVLEEMRVQFPPDRCDPRKVRVLVPGAGLGRLLYEIARLDYSCQGNEISSFMLVGSNFVLNLCREKEKHVIYPWLMSFENNMTCEDQLQPVRVPDVAPAQHSDHPDFSMVAGDFLKVYREHNQWDCVVTCFFIDCAQNVIEFVENIYSILQPGGVWINLGPLLYHYSDAPDQDSIEPPYDILMEIIRDVGFVVEKERTGVKTKYTQNPNWMQQYVYNSVFFVCRKPATAVTRTPAGVRPPADVPLDGAAPSAKY